jgi:hypothetical protein
MMFIWPKKPDAGAGDFSSVVERARGAAIWARRLRHPSKAERLARKYRYLVANFIVLMFGIGLRLIRITVIQHRR